MAKSFNAQMQDRFVKITSDYGAVNLYVHETAVLIAKHAQEHGDCSTAQGLIMAMPASIRREMLILWFSKFTPIVVKNDDKWTAKMHKEGDKMFVPFDIEAGEATPFMTLAQQNKEKAPLDFAGLVLLPQKMAKQLEKRIEDGLVSPDEIETAKALIETFKGIRVQHVNIEKEEAPVEEAPEQQPGGAAPDAAEAPAPDAASEMAAAAA